MTEIGDVGQDMEQITRAHEAQRLSHPTKTDLRERRVSHIRNGLFAIALVFAGRSALHPSTAYAEGATAQSTSDHRIAYLPLVGRSARSLGSIPSPTFQPTVKIPTSTPGTNPTTEPSPSATAEPSATPEMRQLVSLPPDDRIWTGAASPYSPSGDVRSEGVPQEIDLNQPGSGWVENSRRSIYQLVDESGQKYQILRSTLLAALGGDIDKLPNETQVAVDPETTIRRVLADDIELGNLPEGSNPLITQTNDTHSVARDEFGTYYDASQAKSISPLKEAIKDLQIEESNKPQEGDGGVTPVSRPPTVSSSPRGLTNSAFEVPEGETFKLNASLKTISRGSLRLGYHEGINLNQPSRLVILWVDGQEVFLADNKPTAESTNTRFYKLDVNTSRGVLNASVVMNKDRQSITIAVTDAQGEVKTFNHKLPAEMDDRGFYEVDVWTPDSDLNKSTRVSASVEFAQDPQKVADWAEGLDPDSQRKADLTFRGDSLKSYIDSNKIVIPHQSGNEIGFNLPDIGDVAHNGSAGIYDESIVYRISAAIKPSENRGRELWTAVEGHQPFIDGDLRAQIAAQHEAGNTDYKMMVKYDLRTSTGDQSKEVTMSAEAVDAFHDAFLEGYNKDFIAAPMIFEPDGTISRLALRGIDKAVLSRAQTPAAKAEAYANYVMSKLPAGVEFNSSWILDETTPMGITQALNVAEAVHSANKVAGFNIEEVIIIVNESTNVTALTGFIERLQENGITVGLYGADRKMTLSEAAELTKGEANMIDGSLILHNPMNKDDASRSSFLQKTADGLLMYNNEYTLINNKPKSK